jgi:hypothetical protein
MSEHVHAWLNLYHDGELHGARLRQVESHLAECAACRAQLDELQTLSMLLRETVPTGDFTSTERFVANLTLNLPRQTETPLPRKALEIGWWLIPVGLLGTWVFLQITFSLSSVLLAASDAGLLGGSFAWLQGGAPQTEWFAALMQLSGGQLGAAGQTALSYLNTANVFILNLTNGYLWQALLAVLYLGWLGSWGLRQHSFPVISSDSEKSFLP